LTIGGGIPAALILFLTFPAAPALRWTAPDDDAALVVECDEANTSVNEFFAYAFQLLCGNSK
jgi:hypothetical protein